jgi:hypothetical protein
VQPITPDDIVIGCVTEDNPKYLGQALRLLQSIRWFGGELAKSRIVVGAVEHIDGRARRALESYGASVRIVPRFHARNGSGNRLQLFDELRDGSEQHFLMLDCDTIVVRDPLPLLHRHVFQARIAPLPTVTHEVFERLFAHFGLGLPERTHVTGYTHTPTIPYFNAGVFLIPADLAAKLAPEWRRFNAILASDPSLVSPCERHLHQAALALALAVSGIPTEATGVELNYQLNMTQFPAPPGYLDVDPAIIHYHHLVDDDGLLLPCPFPRAQARIDQFHERLREERSRNTGFARTRSDESSAPKQVAVLGMHRSGTSLVGRILHAMGCYAGEETQLAPPDVFNPTGYWEHRDVWALDEEILKALDSTWLDPANADVALLDVEQRTRFVDAARAITKHLDEHGTWMIKDPRLSLLFPLWRDALDRPLCVLVWRDASSVARSLHGRDAMLHIIALALWEEYNRSMLTATIGLPRVLVSYEELIATPVECVAKLHADLMAAGARDLRALSVEEIHHAIDPQLNRNGDGEEAMLNRDQLALEDALRDRSALQWSSVTPTRDATRELLATHNQQSREITRLREAAPLPREDEEASSLLEAVFASRSWRLGFGLSRLYRRFVRSTEPTAEERWRQRQRDRQN